MSKTMEAERSKEKLKESQRLNPHSKTILFTSVIPSGNSGELGSWAFNWEHAVIAFVSCNDLHNLRYSQILKNFVTSVFGCLSCTHTTMQELSPPA